MRTYRLPSYETRLLTELQRQQLSYTFCDTLLQTEDLCVPAHSCILAALSPYLSQKLSTAPPPPFGQKRLVRLQALKPQTLLNLVSLLYSGQLEVTGHVEQNELLAAACQLGMVVTVEGQNERCRHYKIYPEEAGESKKKQEAEVAVEATQRETDPSEEKRNCSSSGAEDADKPVATEPESLDFSLLSRPQSVPLQEDLRSDSSVFVLGEEQSDGDSTNAAAAPQSSDKPIDPVSLDDASSSPPEADVTSQPATEIPHGEQASIQDGDGRGEERRNSAETRPGNLKVATKSLAKMQQMMEKTQISVKVKLRRTSGEVWEVVRLQETDKTLTLLSSLTRNGSNHKRPQRELTNIQPPSCEPQKPQTQISHPATTNSSELAPPPNASSHWQRHPAEDVALASAPVPQPQASVEESDEQIEKLLEDIMMGLNILPDLQSNCKKSCDLSPTMNAAVCRLPVPQDEATQAAAADDCACYQGYKTQNGHSSTDADSFIMPTLSTQPDFKLSATAESKQSTTPPNTNHLSFVDSRWTEVLVATEKLQRQSSSQTNELPLPKTLNNLYPQAETTDSFIASALYSIEQGLYCPGFHAASSQKQQNIFGFLPLSNGQFPLPRLDDLRLRPCLSPLGPCTPAAAAKPPTDHGYNGGQPPSLNGRPWLAENPESLQFPLKNIARRKKKRCKALQQDTRCTQSSMQHLERLEFNGQHGRSCVESVTKNKVGRMESSRREKKKRCETKGDSVAAKRPKRMRPSDPEDGAGSLSAYRDFKVDNKTKSQIVLGVCSVSLSSNNVLAKERETAKSNPNQTDQTRIRTRGFLRKAQAAPSNASVEGSSLPKAVTCKAGVVTKPAPFPKRKPGRPRKIKQENLSVPSVIDGENEQRNKTDSPTDDLEETKRVCNKRRRSMNEEVAVISQKKAINTETAAEAVNNHDVMPAVKRGGKSRHMVSLKEFQQLIKRQHLKTRKSKENQESVINLPEDQVEAHNTVSKCDEGTKETETDVDVTQLDDEESQVGYVTVDKNHNQIFKKSEAGDEGSQPGDKNSAEYDHADPGFTFNVLGEGEGGERQLLNNQDQASTCSSGSADLTQTSSSDDFSSRSLIKTPAEQESNPWTAERTRSEFSCPKEEEEEEVDVLLYSPDKITPPRECEDGPDNSDITAEEEDDDDDLIEVDVTGDEAE